MHTLMLLMQKNLLSSFKENEAAISEFLELECEGPHHR